MRALAILAQSFAHSHAEIELVPTVADAIVVEDLVMTAPNTAGTHADWEHVGVTLPMGVKTANKRLTGLFSRVNLKSHDKVFCYFFLWNTIQIKINILLTLAKSI